MFSHPLNIKELKDRLDENIFIIENAAIGLLIKDVGGDAKFYSFGLFKSIYNFSGGKVTTHDS